MRCPTAVLPNTGVRGAHQYRRTCWSDNPSGARKEGRDPLTSLQASDASEPAEA
jgi:hypothetical protein